MWEFLSKTLASSRLELRSIKQIRFRLARICSILLAGAAIADGPCERRFSWSIDNGPIPVDEFRMYCTPALPQQQVFLGTETTWQAAPGDFPAGNYSCELTAADVEGESPRSNPVTFDTSEGAACATIIFTVDS